MRSPTGGRRFHVWLGALSLMALVGGGCATAQPSGRKGLLEGVAISDHSHRSKKFAMLARGQGDEEVADASDDSLPMHAPPEGTGTSRRPAIEVSAGALRWPLQQVQVTSPYGQRGREFHEGIDLKAQTGTPVLAAQEGTVIYSGSQIRGYGRMIVLRHFRQISTIYAHNSKLLVRNGQYVRQGQRIAISGKSGHVTGPHLHFEVRDGQSALNPQELLPTSHVSAPEIKVAEPANTLVAAREESRPTKGLSPTSGTVRIAAARALAKSATPVQARGHARRNRHRKAGAKDAVHASAAHPARAPARVARKTPSTARTLKVALNPSGRRPASIPTAPIRLESRPANSDVESD